VAKGIAKSNGHGPAPPQPGEDPERAALYTVVASGPTLLAYVVLGRAPALRVLGYACVVDSVILYEGLLKLTGTGSDGRSEADASDQDRGAKLAASDNLLKTRSRSCHGYRLITRRIRLKVRYNKRVAESSGASCYEQTRGSQSSQLHCKYLLRPGQLSVMIPLV
jgi:hypothetical protein